MYPPGVTGNEYQIAGPDRDWEDTRTCYDCGPTEHYFESYRGAVWATCTECGRQVDLEPDDPREDDPRV